MPGPRRRPKVEHPDPKPEETILLLSRSKFGVQMSRRTQGGTATGRHSSSRILTVGGTRLTAILAVVELILLVTAGLTTGAGEDAGLTLRLETRFAFGRLDGHVRPEHVDLTGNVDGTPGWIHGELAPSVADHGGLVELGRWMDGRPTTTRPSGKGQGAIVARLHGYRDVGLFRSNPRRAPGDEDDILLGGIGEGVGKVAISSDPDAAVVGHAVLATLDAETFELRRMMGHQMIRGPLLQSILEVFHTSTTVGSRSKDRSSLSMVMLVLMSNAGGNSLAKSSSGREADEEGRGMHLGFEIEGET